MTAVYNNMEAKKVNMSERAPAISVIIPTYNRAGILPKAVDSVLKQTFGDLELLVVDDGSTDNTAGLIEEYRQRDARVHYIYQENARQAAARNNGLKHARGKFIAFLDSDDEWTLDKLEKQIKYLESHPDCGMVYTNQLIRDLDSSEESLKYPPDRIIEGHIFEQLLDRKVYCSTPTVLVAKSVVDKAGLFDEKFENALEDWEWTMRVAHECKVGYMKEPLFIRYVHDEYSREYALIRMRNHRLILEKIFAKYQIPAKRQRELWRKGWFSWGMAALEAGYYGRSMKCFFRALLLGKLYAFIGFFLALTGPLGKCLIKQIIK